MKFVDELPPEAPRHHGHDWGPCLAKLRAHPGQWAHLEPGKDDVPNFTRRGAYALAGRIREGRTSAFAPAGTYDASVRGGELYACYVDTTEAGER